MLKLEEPLTTHDGVVDFSYRDSWRLSGRGSDDATFVVLGDSERGPVMTFWRTPPLVGELLTGPAHGHASDTWRITLKGEMPVGKDRYPALAFRLQQGWRSYGGDNVALGPEGGWSMTMFADRRGTRTRLVHERDGPIDYEKPLFVDWIGITTGDQVTDDPRLLPGPTGVATVLGPPRGGRVDGSFAGSDTWTALAPGVRAAMHLCGDPERGPVVLTQVGDPSAVTTPAFVCETEIVRVVVDGSCTAGAVDLVPGDVRIQAAGSRAAEAVAGPLGVKEFLVFGDRRSAVPATVGDHWATGFRQMHELLRRAVGTPSGTARDVVEGGPREPR